jgi:hypothetical protein
MAPCTTKRIVRDLFATLSGNKRETTFDSSAEMVNAHSFQSDDENAPLCCTYC